jgi:hypothetical protein
LDGDKIAFIYNQEPAIKEDEAVSFRHWVGSAWI